MTTTESVSADTAAKVDANPFFRSASETIWERAETTRDVFAAAIQEAADQANYDILLHKSERGTYPAWLTVEAWLPVEGFDSAHDPRQRSKLMISIDTRAYNQFQLVVSATATRGKKTISISERPSFSRNDALEWAEYVLGRRGKPSNYTPVVDAIAAIFLSFIPFAKPPHHNPLQRQYKKSFPFTFAQLLIGVAAACLVFAFLVSQNSYSVGPEVAWLILAAVACGLTAAVLIARRQPVISVTPQPVVPPRELIMLDSWHTLIPELGRNFDEVKRRIVGKISEGESMGLTCEPEIYGFRTPYKFEQRERLVVTKVQSVVHVHIYKFGDDVFVGWDAYLNWARWQDSNSVASKVENGNFIEFRDLRPDLYVPNQFDLIDLNNLSDFVHRWIEIELKALLKEHKIDQEIDFAIIRGDRDQALDEERGKARRKTPKRQWKIRSPRGMA